MMPAGRLIIKPAVISAAQATVKKNENRLISLFLKIPILFT